MQILELIGIDLALTPAIPAVTAGPAAPVQPPPHPWGRRGGCWVFTSCTVGPDRGSGLPRISSGMRFQTGSGRERRSSTAAGLPLVSDELCRSSPAPLRLLEHQSVEPHVSDLTLWARTALRQAGVSLPAEDLERFVADIDASVAMYRDEQAATVQTARGVHNELRQLFALLERDDAPVGQIRSRVRALSDVARQWVIRRAFRLWPHLLGGDASGATFEEWLLRAAPSELIRVLRVCVSEGGRVVRPRPDRPKSLRFEPMIMGTIRGASGAGRGGRPSLTARDELVMLLTLDWYKATSQHPAPGRADHGAFAGLVHCVFQLNGIQGAEQALRRYWAAVPSKRPVRPVRRAPARKSSR
jgi:hypothetical protein